MPTIDKINYNNADQHLLVHSHFEGVWSNIEKSRFKRDKDTLKVLKTHIVEYLRLGKCMILLHYMGFNNCYCFNLREVSKMKLILCNSKLYLCIYLMLIVK